MAATLNLTTGIVFLKSWTGTIVGDSISLADGTAPLPALSFVNDPTLGFRRSGSSTVYLAKNVSAVALGIGPINANGSMQINGGGSPAGVRGGSDVGWYNGAAAESNAMDSGISRISAGLYGVGTGTLASFAGGMKMSTLLLIAGTGTQVGTVGSTIFSSVTATGSTGGGAEADVSSYSMPANTLSANGQALVVSTGAVHAANANSTTLRTYFNGSALNSTTEATSNAVPATEYRLVRISSSTAFYTGVTSSSSGGLARFAGTISGLDFTAAIILKYSVQAATTTNDLIGNHMRVEWKAA